MLTTDTRELLRSLIPLNNSMIIAPTQTGCDEFKSIFFKLDLHKIEENLQEFGIFDMGSFLTSLDLLEEPVITLEGDKIIAKDADSSIEYKVSDVSSLDYVQVPESNITTTQASESTLEFNFDNELLTKLKKAKGVFKNFDTLYINNTSSGVSLKLGNNNAFSKSENSFEVQVPPTLNLGRDFNVVVPLESIMKIPNMSYTARVKYNDKKDMYRVVFDNEVIAFVISIKK